MRATMWRNVRVVLAGGVVLAAAAGVSRLAGAAEGLIAIDAELTAEAWQEAGLCGLASPVRARPAAFRPYPVVTVAGETAVDGVGAADAAAGVVADGAVSDVADAAVVSPVTGTGGEADPDCGAGGMAGGGLGAAGFTGGRFYLAGIIGASFGTLQSGGVNTAGGFTNAGSASDSLLTAGAAVGTAWERADGRVRLELEGRGRDALVGTTGGSPPPPTVTSVRAVDGWSVLTNVWRDWSLGDRLGVYGGGGIGGGGYRLTVNDGAVGGYGHVGGFAWQVGMGAVYDLTERATIDLGYRFFDTQSTPLALAGAGGPAGTYRSNFYASELLLTVRIYEPFRDPPRRWIPAY